MVRRVVGVGERDQIVSDVIFAVLKPADRRLGLAQAIAVAGARDRYAVSQRDQLVDVRGRGCIVDIVAADRRLRLGSGERCGDRRAFRGARPGDDDVGRGQRLLVVGLPFLVGAGRLVVGSGVDASLAGALVSGPAIAAAGSSKAPVAAAASKVARKTFRFIIIPSSANRSVTVGRVRGARRRPDRPGADRRAGDRRSSPRRRGSLPDRTGNGRRRFRG